MRTRRAGDNGNFRGARDGAGTTSQSRERVVDGRENNLSLRLARPVTRPREATPSVWLLDASHHGSDHESLTTAALLLATSKQWSMLISTTNIGAAPRMFHGITRTHCRPA